MFKVGDTGKTRGGDNYRVICVDALGKYPVIALVMEGGGREYACRYAANGKVLIKESHNYDLIKQPVREVLYAPLYKTASGYIEHTDPKHAIAKCKGSGGYTDRTLEITLEDGKPVEARIVFVEDGE